MDGPNNGRTQGNTIRRQREMNDFYWFNYSNDIKKSRYLENCAKCKFGFMEHLHGSFKQHIFWQQKHQQPCSYFESGKVNFIRRTYKYSHGDFLPPDSSLLSPSRYSNFSNFPHYNRIKIQNKVQRYHSIVNRSSIPISVFSGDANCASGKTDKNCSSTKRKNRIKNVWCFSFMALYSLNTTTAFRPEYCAVRCTEMFTCFKQNPFIIIMLQT